MLLCLCPVGWLSLVETANRAETEQCQDTNLILILWKSLLSSNLNSKLFRFHCVRPNIHPIDDLSMVLLLGTRKRQPKTVILNEFLCTAYIWFMTHVPRPLLIILCILHKQWFVLVRFCLVRPFWHLLSTFP